VSMANDERAQNPINFPVEETAPLLDYYTAAEPSEPFHVSKLELDPAATVDLQSWARLYYQMCHVDSSGMRPGFAATPTAAITVAFPSGDTYIDNVLQTWLTLRTESSLKNEQGRHEGWLLSAVTFDLIRPGVVTAADYLVSKPEAIPMTTRFTPFSRETENTYFYTAEDDTTIAVREAEYQLGTGGVIEMISMLRTASSSQSEMLVQRFNDSLEAMEPSVREACHKYFRLGEDLISDS
jgi:hypothetical protein